MVVMILMTVMTMMEMVTQARKEMVTLLSSVISARRAEQASGTSTVEKTDLLQVRLRLRHHHQHRHYHVPYYLTLIPRSTLCSTGVQSSNDVTVQFHGHKRLT